MTAPSIPRKLTPRARAWPAWEHIWDQLDDGEWQRGADLVESALREHVADFGPNQMRTYLASAAAHGLLDRETRRAVAFVDQSTALAGPRRPAADPWYRRPA